MTLSPKHLSFDEMWQLYKQLRNGVSDKEFLVDEMSELLSKLSPQEYFASLRLMYPNMDIYKVNPVDSVSMFIDGLTKNDFFFFCDTMNGFLK